MEAKTDAGQVNALLIVTAAALMAVVGGPDLLGRLIGLWAKNYTSSFPVVPVLGILIGGGLICVLLLVLLEPLLQERQNRGRRK